MEYVVLEYTYARRRPQAFARLVERFGHIAVAAAGGASTGSGFTASQYLAARLSHLARRQEILLRPGPATGCWGVYLREVSWVALPPSPDWADRLSWEEFGTSMD